MMNPPQSAYRGLLYVFVTLSTSAVPAESTEIEIDTPVTPPTWALLERELVRANAAACAEFFERYFDQRGFLLCVERWGGDDGPDDAIENCNDWPLLHALGADDVVLAMFKKAWEGHLRQYTLAKTTEVPLARDGMYYKEFPVMFDWVHNGEGLSAFNQQGLSDPYDARFRKRVRRYAGFYMNEDPGAPNYDSRHKVIRSLFNGSRGPLLRKATGLDWAGDPIEVKNRFRLGHGEESYEQMIEHFKDYNDVVGDHPQNLVATSLALNAYMITGEDKYRRWLLEYVDAWRDRMSANDDVIPTNIGLDGTIGGEADGKWYGGVYGWSFSVVVPQDGSLAHRNTHHLGLFGFLNAYLLTGDDRYLSGWRRQIDKINSQARTIDGRLMVPRMYGDNGWYAYAPGKYRNGALDIFFCSMRPDDRRRVGPNSWLDFLDGRNPDYPELVLRSDLERVRNRIEAMRRDPTTPDTRLADDPMKFNPASVSALTQLTLGGLPLGHNGSLLMSRVRYFDVDGRRAGLPADVAALVDSMSADGIAIRLVNLSQLEARSVVIQAGSYAQDRFGVVTFGDKTRPVDGPHLSVRLQPGCGARLRISTSRFCRKPTLSFPWTDMKSLE